MKVEVTPPQRVAPGTEEPPRSFLLDPNSVTVLSPWLEYMSQLALRKEAEWPIREVLPWSLYNPLERGKGELGVRDTLTSLPLTVLAGWPVVALGCAPECPLNVHPSRLTPACHRPHSLGVPS